VRQEFDKSLLPSLPLPLGEGLGWGLSCRTNDYLRSFLNRADPREQQRD